jgi:hypothetical protein
MKRHRRSRSNPTSAQWLMIGGAALGVGVIGYLVYKANTPAPALPSGIVAGAVQTVTLAPGSMGAINLKLANAGTISLFAPSGGTLQSAAFAPQGILSVPASGAAFEYVATAVGTTTCTATYTDTAGATQTSTFTVTVS